MLRNSLRNACAALLIASAFVTAPSQSRVVDLPGADPFKIELGSSFSASGGSVQTPAGPAGHPISKDLEEALALVDRNYAGPRRDNAKLAASAIDGMLSVLDPHSSFFTEEEYRQLLEEQRSEYYGIGATIANYSESGDLHTYVIAVQPGSPASAAGLRYGDRFVSVNGENMAGKTSDVVRDKIRGRLGTIISVQVERADGRVFELPIRRGRVPQPTVADFYVIRPGVGYIDLTAGFSFTTGREVSEALNSLRRAGADAFVLDLRGNPGGVLEQAVKVAENFIPAGKPIVSQRGRSDYDNRTWRSSNLRPIDSPVVVLVDDASASASEVVAGALQDYDRALIVGEKTFGKGLVQSVIDLPGRAGLALTTARYYTPSGRSLQRSYSGSSIYDYFSHKPTSAESRRETETAGHRKVFAGDGITPDEIVSGEDFTPTANLLDRIFFFAREASAAEKRSPAPVRTAGGGSVVETALRQNDTDLLASFAHRMMRNGTTELPVRSGSSSVLARHLRYELTLAAKGRQAADRYLVATDPQVLRALELIPRAAEMARSSRSGFRAANQK